MLIWNTESKEANSAKKHQHSIKQTLKQSLQIYIFLEGDFRFFIISLH